MQCIHTIAPRPSLYTVNQSVNINTIRKETGTNTPNGCADLSLDPRSTKVESTINLLESSLE